MVSIKEDGDSGRLQSFLYFAELDFAGLYLAGLRVVRRNLLLRLRRSEKRLKYLSEVFC